MVTRGERIRRTRRRQGLSQREVAEAVGISDRTIGRIELGQTADPVSIDRVEDYLGINKETPARITAPPLDKATDAELAVEILRRLNKAREDDDGADEPLPDDVRDDPELLLAPPDEDQAERPESS